MHDRKAGAPSNALTLENARIPETWSALLVPRLILPWLCC